MTTATSSALDRLAELDQAIRDAKKRHASYTADRNTARRKVVAAEGEFEAYQEAVGFGEIESDPDEVARLEAAIKEAEAGAADRVWNPRIEGAARAIQEAETARDEFARREFESLAAENAVLDPPVRDRLQAAYEELEAAESAYALRVRAWHSIREAGGLSPDDLPGLPTRGEEGEVRARFAAGIEAPTPRPLLRKENR